MIVRGSSIRQRFPMHVLAQGVPILLMAGLGFAMGASAEDVRRRGLWRAPTATTLTLAVAIFVMLVR
jgi:hypothetical protein